MLISFLFLSQLNEKGIRIIGMGSNKLRIVTHLDYTDAMHEEFTSLIKKI